MRVMVEVRVWSMALFKVKVRVTIRVTVRA